MQPGSSYGDPTRANDADRAEVCAILDNAYADGELDADEHRQRCSSAMSAKTRSRLLDLTSDLQARLPVFAQQPTIAVKANPNQKWIIGAVVGSVLAAVAIGGGVMAIWHRGSSPSPTAPVAAHTQTVSSEANSEATGTYLPLADVVGTVSGDFQDLIGHAPERVNCTGDLDGRVGAFERCSIIDKGKRYTADVTVTAVNGTRITTHESINEEVSPAPSSVP
jgi:Domain of unknown function (DUF1707)/Domain of unknown function (DUF4333)